MNINVCDDCLTAAYDEGVLDYETQVDVCIELGGEIADHLCEEVQDSDTEPCACACHRSRRDK